MMNANSRYSCSTGLVVFPLFFLAACNLSIDQGAADYGLHAGSRLTGVLIETSPGRTTQKFVSTSLAWTPASADTETQVRLDLQESAASRAVPALAEWNGWTLTVQVGEDRAEGLAWNVQSECFESETAQLCLSDGNESDSTTVELQYHHQEGGREINLVLDPAESVLGGSLEAPRSYTVTELTKLGIDRSFTSQVQFTTVQKSRDDALTAHLNLLPHVGMGEVVGVLNSGLNTASLIRSIGNLVPFLFPSRWFKASELKHQAQADQDAYRILQADSGNLIEGLAYNLLRDERVQVIDEEYLASLSSLVTLLQDRENLGVAAPGSAANLLTVANALKQTIHGLKSTVAAEKIGLARAAGFMNPAAVSEVVPPAEVPVQLPGIVQSPDLQNLVLHRSMELQQLDDLLLAARSNVKSTVFSVFDPSGGAFLGFGLGSQIRASRDQVSQVLVRKTNEQSALLAALELSLNSIRTSVQNYVLANENLHLQKNRIQLLTDQMALGLPVTIIELQDAFQNVLTAEANSLTARYSYLIALGGLNRLLYVGPYAGLGRD